MSRNRIAGVLLGSIVGISLGVGAFTFLYARGFSYLTNDPGACVNCHVMEEQFAGWVKSSHRAVAVCNDCHAPHSLAEKYAVKLRNGFRHSLAFTAGRFPEPIRITGLNARVTEGACRHCHEDVVLAMDGPDRKGEPVSCVVCHRSVGHLH